MVIQGAFSFLLLFREFFPHHRSREREDMNYMRKIKTWITYLLVALCLMSSILPASSHASAESYKIKINGKTQIYKDKKATVYINGKKQSFSTPGILISGTALVGATDLVKRGFGGTYSYSSASGKITLIYGDTTIKLKLGSKTATVNGKKEKISVAPTKIYFVKEKVTKVCVPSRFVSESFGFDYNWNASKGRISIDTEKNGLPIYQNGEWTDYKGPVGTITVNGKKISNGGMPPLVIDDALIVRAKLVFATTLGAKYTYKSKTVTLTFNEHTFSAKIGEDTALADGEEIDLATPAVTVKNAGGTSYVMVPVQEVAAALGISVKCNLKKGTATLTGEAQEEPEEEDPQEDPDDDELFKDYKGLPIYYDGKWHDYTGTKGIVNIYGNKVSAGKMPSIIINSTALLRAKNIFGDHLGATYIYKKPNLTLIKDGVTIEFTIGSTTAYVNGIAQTLDTAPRVIKNKEGTGYTMVPGRFTANALGFDYEWSEEKKTSFITEHVDATEDIEPNAVFLQQSAGEETRRLMTLPDNVTIPGTGTDMVSITGVQQIPNGDGISYVITASGPLGTVYGSKSGSAISLVFKNATGETSAISGDGNYVTGISRQNDAEQNSHILTFSLGSIAAGKYELTMSPDQMSVTLNVYQNRLTNFTAAMTAAYDYVLITGLSAPDYQYTHDGEMMVVVLRNALSSEFGSVSQSVGNRGLMTNVSLTPSGTDLILTVQHGLDCDATVQNYGDTGILVKMTASASTRSKITLPVDYSQVTVEDDYVNHCFNIIMPGYYYQFYESNPLSISNEMISKVSVSIVNDDTIISIKTTKIMGFELTGSGMECELRVGEPRDIYDKIIILDPGHGGDQTGAIKGGIYEKNLTFDILYTRAKEYFDSPTSTVKAYWTRTGDNNDRDLYSRADMAKEVGADYFLSLHLNSYTKSSVNGLEVYYSSANNKTIDNGLSSIKMAKFVEERLPERIGMTRKDNAVRQAAYVVLKKNTVPAILVELLYMSNSKDLARVKDEDFRETTAENLYEIVEELFETYPTGR